MVDGRLGDHQLGAEKVGDWTIIRVKSLESAAEALNVSFSDAKIDNLVFGGHGPGGDVDESMLFTSSSNGFLIPEDVQQFNQNRSGSYRSPYIYAELMALEQIVQQTDQNANIVFLPCGGGNEESMGIEITKLVNNAKGNNQANVFLSNDNTSNISHDDGIKGLKEPRFEMVSNIGEAGFDKYTTFNGQIFKFKVGDLILKLYNPESKNGSIIQYNNQGTPVLLEDN